MPADFEVVEANNKNNNNMSSPQSPNFTNHKFQNSFLIFNGESLEKKYLEIFSQSCFTGGCLDCGQDFENFRIYVENIREIFENVFENIKIYFDFFNLFWIFDCIFIAV